MLQQKQEEEEKDNSGHIIRGEEIKHEPLCLLTNYSLSQTTNLTICWHLLKQVETMSRRSWKTVAWTNSKKKSWELTFAQVY